MTTTANQPTRRLTQQEIDHQRAMEVAAANAKAAAERERLRLDAEIKRSEAAAKAAAAAAQAKAAEAEAQARIDAIKAQNDPTLLAKKQELELKRQAAEAEAISAETRARVGVQIGAAVVGITAGHGIAHWIDSRSIKAAQLKSQALSDLAGKTNAVLARSDKRALRNVTITRFDSNGQPRSVSSKFHPMLTKAGGAIVGAGKEATKRASFLIRGRSVSRDDLRKAQADRGLAANDKKRLVGGVRAFDSQKLGHVKGPLGVAFAALLAADALYARHRASAEREHGTKAAAEARKASAEARERGDKQLAEHLERVARSHESDAKSSGTAWDTFGTANWFAAGGLLATRFVQRETLQVKVDAANISRIEAAREATGLSQKTAIQTRAIAAASATKPGVVSTLLKSSLLKTAAKLVPVVAGVVIANDIYNGLHKDGQRVSSGGATGDSARASVASVGGASSSREAPAAEKFAHVTLDGRIVEGTQAQIANWTSGRGASRA
jgi:hypothetical protein